MQRRTLPLIGLVWLTGCATAGGCELLPLKAYTPAFNERLVGEVQAASADAVWPQAVIDYVALRDAVRACK